MLDGEKETCDISITWSEKSRDGASTCAALLATYTPNNRTQCTLGHTTRSTQEQTPNTSKAAKKLERCPKLAGHRSDQTIKSAIVDTAPRGNSNKINHRSPSAIPQKYPA